MNTDDFPVENVSWEDCQTFIRKLNALAAAKLPSGYFFRLPSEAEWERAARAGTASAYFWGAALNGDQANGDGRARRAFFDF